MAIGMRLVAECWRFHGRTSMEVGDRVISFVIDAARVPQVGAASWSLS
ncbi:hypothetical protein ACIQUG_32025 [Ensifer sp. NPDC090286]